MRATVNAGPTFAHDHPVVATNWSNITPVLFFDPFAYSTACFPVNSRRALIDNV